MTITRMYMMAVLAAAGSLQAVEIDDARKGLEERGITLGFTYSAEVFSVASGGTRSESGNAAYIGSLVPNVTLELERMGVGRGHVYVSGQWLHGRGINDSRVGAVQALSNLDNAHFAKLLEAWYSDAYLGGAIVVKAGRQYADADFGTVENGADFLNSSYGLNPTTPMPTFPAPELGASLWVTPLSWLSLGAGVFQGGTMEGLTEDAAPVNRKPFTMFEAKLSPFRKTANSHGIYRIGVWWQSRGAWLANDETGAAPVRNYGLYAAGDHWFHRSPSGGHRGPGVFFQWGWNPSDRNEMKGYKGGGVVWRGMSQARLEDSVGAGVTRADLCAGKRETILEVFYRFHVSKLLTIQPDVQFVVRPSGEGRNALVAGVRTAWTF